MTEIIDATRERGIPDIGDITIYTDRLIEKAYVERLDGGEHGHMA